jgi:hypothetical protein
MQGKSHKVIVCMAMILCGAFAGCETHQAAQNQTALHNRTFTQKLPAPKEVTFDANLNPFEKQFRIDTGETNLTRRSEVDQSVRIDELAKDRLLFKFDFSAWPQSLRPLARLWVAVGASSAIATDGTLGLTFSQNGIGVFKELNYAYNVDGTILMGSDFAVKDGEVAVQIENRTHLSNLHYTLHAIVYVPRKAGPVFSAAKP